VVVLAVGGDEVRSLLVGAVFTGHQVLAGVRPSARTCVALAAEPKVRRHNAIADGQRLAARVGGQAVAQFRDLAGHFAGPGRRGRWAGRLRRCRPSAAAARRYPAPGWTTETRPARSAPRSRSALRVSA